jgi:hypothetical protein
VVLSVHSRNVSFMGSCSPMEPLSSKLSKDSDDTGSTICSTAELTGDCFTRCLASFTTTFFNAQQSLLVIKRGLSGRGFVVVVPSLFQFTTITSPTTDFDNLRRVAMSLTGFLLMWQPVTSPRSKSLGSPALRNFLVLPSNEGNEQDTAFCLLLYRYLLS